MNSSCYISRREWSQSFVCNLAYFEKRILSIVGLLKHQVCNTSNEFNYLNLSSSSSTSSGINTLLLVTDSSKVTKNLHFPKKGEVLTSRLTGIDPIYRQTGLFRSRLHTSLIQLTADFREQL